MRKFLFIISVFAVFGLSPAMAEYVAQPENCTNIDLTENGNGEVQCSGIQGCTSYEAICVNNRVTCSCTVCDSTNDWQLNGTTPASCVKNIEMGVACNKATHCYCCEAPGDTECANSAFRDTAKGVLYLKCVTVAPDNPSAQCGDKPKNYQNITTFCASQGPNQVLCDNGYYNYNSNTGECTRCPQVSDANNGPVTYANGNPVYGTTLDYETATSASTSSDAGCCLPKLSNSNARYYDNRGSFSNYSGN